MLAIFAISIARGMDKKNKVNSEKSGKGKRKVNGRWCCLYRTLYRHINERSTVMQCCSDVREKTLTGVQLLCERFKFRPWRTKTSYVKTLWTLCLHVAYVEYIYVYRFLMLWLFEGFLYCYRFCLIYFVLFIKH